MRKPKPTEALTQDDAAYLVCHEFGVAKLAKLLDLPPTTLYTKVDPYQPSCLTSAELVRVSILTRDDRLIEATCREIGGAFYRLPEVQRDSDASLLEMLCKLGAEEGEFCQRLWQFMADGDISLAEFKVLDKELFDIVAAVARLRERIREIADGRF